MFPDILITRLVIHSHSFTHRERKKKSAFIGKEGEKEEGLKKKQEESEFTCAQI